MIDILTCTTLHLAGSMSADFVPVHNSPDPIIHKKEQTTIKNLLLLHAVLVNFNQQILEILLLFRIRIERIKRAHLMIKNGFGPVTLLSLSFVTNRPILTICIKI